MPTFSSAAAAADHGAAEVGGVQVPKFPYAGLAAPDSDCRNCEGLDHSAGHDDRKPFEVWSADEPSAELGTAGSGVELPTLGAWVEREDKDAEWTRLWMVISAGGWLSLHAKEVGPDAVDEPRFRCEVAACEIRDPKTSRKNRPHCFRINVPTEKNVKFIIDPLGQKNRNEWFHGLASHRGWLMLPWAGDVATGMWIEGSELVDIPRHLLVRKSCATSRASKASSTPQNF